MAERPHSAAEDSTHAPSQINGVWENEPFLDPPRAPYLMAETPTQGSSIDSQNTSPNNSSPNLLSKPEDNENEFTGEVPRGEKRNPRALIWAGAAIAIVIIVIAVVIPVYFVVIKPNQNKTSGTSGSSGSSSGGGGSGGGNPNSPSGAITGGDGSTVLLDDGSSFTYSNKFGGYWYSDPSDPFNNGARPNDWTPPLNSTWTWGKDRAYGVNLGGLFVLEPFISPALFQKYPGTTDEWSLSEAMAADTASGGLDQLEEHYKTFITEQDIAEIAGAGLNWIRLPIPYWAIDTWPGEPFLAKTSWKYILRLLGWARKYGLRVNLDLHTIPGSQNGYNHSGKGGKVNFMNGVMGIANAQRTLNYIRIITEFISQPEYKDVVPMFGIINEALISTIGKDTMTSFYLEAHNMMRSIGGYGAGNGPYIGIHDGFQGISEWAGFLPGSDRIILDTHPYFAFGGGANDEPIATGTGSNAGGPWPAQACNSWASAINNSQSNFGVTVAGEFSNGYNDCGLFLKGTQDYTPNYGDCSEWQDSSNWDASTKAGVQAFAEASMDALGDFFFWTWKIGNSTKNRVESPLWSYKLGLENGWMPTDPRTAIGKCASLGTKSNPFDGTYESWQTGGAGAGTIAATATAAFPWPPPSINHAGADPTSLPQYTSTGTVNTLPPPTMTASATASVDLGDGWFNTADNGLAPTTIAGCTYPDAWDAVDAAVPPACGGGDAAATTAPARR